MTGRYQQRYRLERALPNSMQAGDQGLRSLGLSLPQLLKNNRYATGLGPGRMPRIIVCDVNETFRANTARPTPGGFERERHRGRSLVLDFPRYCHFARSAVR